MPTEADFFPSKYLRVADLKGRSVRVTIDRVTTEVFENDGKKQTKPVLEFKDKNVKPLVCNKTNFGLVAAMHGPDTDDWNGKAVGLHKEFVSFKGKVTESIRVIRADQEMNDAIGFS